MIKRLRLKNYRCYNDVEIDLKDVTIVVGKNNAGKSTLIEALRLVALAIKKSHHTTFKATPKGLNISGRIKGFKLDVSKIKIDMRGIVYFYGDESAEIEAQLESGHQIRIYASSEIVWVIIYDSNGKNIKSKKEMESINEDYVNILPQIGLIKDKEKWLSDETVYGDRDSYLSSRHFRNEIFRYKSLLKDFKNMVEETWPGLTINSIDYDEGSENISLYVRDGDFATEVGLMGSGVQMWLQIIWFLCRSKISKSVILDEPDVYMHPDLQIRLLRMIEERHTQVILATHSVEIISEANPDSILIVDKNMHKLRYATDIPAVQDIVEKMGGTTNLSLMRIGQAKKCLFLEGDDIKVLRKIASIINADLVDVLDSIPVVRLDGFCNVPEAYGTANLFFSETQGTVKCYCILDKDYYDETVLEKEKEKAKEKHLCLHIWHRKEIENYLLEPNVLFKVVKSREKSYDAFLTKLNCLLEEEREEVHAQLSAHFYKSDKRQDMSQAIKRANEFMKQRWTTIENKLSLVGGKDFIKKFNGWTKEEYGLSCSVHRILSLFESKDFSEEMIEVLYQICNE